MRTIEFRGKRFGNGCWVYGYLVESETAWDDYNGYQLPTEYEIGIVRTDVCIREFIKIDVDTVCQYTGLKDKNGVKIYEGDIIMWSEYQPNSCDYDTEELQTEKYRVVFINGMFVAENLEDYFPRHSLLTEFNINSEKIGELEVIGNIYDNLELAEA